MAAVVSFSLLAFRLQSWTMCTERSFLSERSNAISHLQFPFWLFSYFRLSHRPFRMWRVADYEIQLWEWCVREQHELYPSSLASYHTGVLCSMASLLGPSLSVGMQHKLSSMLLIHHHPLRENREMFIWLVGCCFKQSWECHHQFHILQISLWKL